MQTVYEDHEGKRRQGQSRNKKQLTQENWALRRCDMISDAAQGARSQAAYPTVCSQGFQSSCPILQKSPNKSLVSVEIWKGHQTLSVGNRRGDPKGSEG